MITATYDDRADKYVLDVPGKPRFKSIAAGFGYLNAKEDGDFSSHWCAVVGQAEDDGYVVLEECPGSAGELAEALCSAKDRLLIEAIYHDDRNPPVIQGMSRLDGLTGYERKGSDHFERPVYVHAPEYWPTFVSYEHHVTSFVPVDPTVATVEAAVEIVATVRRQGRLGFRDDCLRTNWLLRQTIDDWLKHPLMQAIGYPILMMELNRFHGGYLKDRDESPAYPNFKRR